METQKSRRPYKIGIPKSLDNEYLRKHFPIEELEAFLGPNLQHLEEENDGDKLLACLHVPVSAYSRKLSESDGFFDVGGMRVNKMQIDLAYLIATTGNVAMAAESLGASVARVHNMALHNDNFRRLIQYFCDIIAEEMRPNLLRIAGKALATMDTMISDPHLDPDLRFRVAKDILDRAGIRPENKQTIDVTTKNVNYFTKLSPHEVMELAKMDFTEVIDGEFAENSGGPPGDFEEAE